MTTEDWFAGINNTFIQDKFPMTRNDKPQNMRELIAQQEQQQKDRESATETVEYVDITGELAKKFAADAADLSQLAFELNRVSYRDAILMLKFTPGELHTLTVAATILRKKGADLADAMVRGKIVKLKTASNPSRPLATDNGKQE